MSSASEHPGSHEPDLYRLLGLETEEKRLALLRLRELGTEPSPTQKYIFPLSNNSSVPPLGDPYVAKLERHP
jgi:hypothetical protein